jgi:NAD(P)-dependent dehydrogenase (short-subunit alcohol dehydrogenase family)
MTALPARAFAGRVVLVTGASRGIGAAVAAGFAAAAAQVVLAARDDTALDRQVNIIAAAGGEAVALPVDVTREESVAALLDGIWDRFGRLDAAVNNAAGGGRPPLPLADWGTDEFDSALAVNLRGTFLCMKHELRLMLTPSAGGARPAAIVNMSSTAGERGVAGLAGYAASKYGVGGLTRVAALDYAGEGVRVNAIAPGPVLTDRLAAAGPVAQQRVAAAVPLGRIGSVDDVAAAALWLCSDASSFVTGTVLTVDGGQLAGVPAFALHRQDEPTGSRD